MIFIFGLLFSPSHPTSPQHWLKQGEFYSWMHM